MDQAPATLRPHRARAGLGVARQARVRRPAGTESGRPSESPPKGSEAGRLLVSAHVPARRARCRPWPVIKVRKAMFGTRVVLNGQALGDHLPSFTPGYFRCEGRAEDRRQRTADPRRRRPRRRGAGHSLRIRFRERALHPGHLRLRRVDPLRHAAFHAGAGGAGDRRPDRAGAGRVAKRRRAENGRAASLWCARRRSGREVGRRHGRTGQPGARTRRRRWRSASPSPTAGCGRRKIRFSTRWKPTAARTGFGRGSACASSGSIRRPGRAMLNGKPYFMRGSNITLYRFFEDERVPGSAVAGGLGAAAAPAGERDALELPALLHRLPAGSLVRHRRRGGHPDPGRVSHLEPHAGNQSAKNWPRNTPSGCASAGTIRAS